MGNYVYRELNDDNAIAAGLLFGAIGAGIAAGVAAENSGTDSQYFYSRLNDKFEHSPDVELPAKFISQYKIFDFNRNFKFRTYFRVNNKNVFCVYHPFSKKLMFVSE